MCCRPGCDASCLEIRPAAALSAWVGLPNVLLKDFAVPELLQDDATPEKLAEATWACLTDKDNAARVEARFTALHEALLRDTPALAAQAILEVAHGPG